MELYQQFHTHSITEKELELHTVNIKKCLLSLKSACKLS